MPTWTNSDGLVIKTGVDEATAYKVAEYNYLGGQHVLVIDVNVANLPAVASNSVNISDKFTLPRGVQVDKVELIGYETFVGVGATLNVGITDADGGTTIQDVDALVVEATIAELNAGGTGTASDGVFGGAGLSVVLTETALLTWEVNTAAITAGRGVIRIYYTVPDGVTDTLGTVTP